MKRTAVLHHTKVDLPHDCEVIQSYAAYTHMLNFKSEVPDAEFISFSYLNKYQLYTKSKRLAPWFFFKWISIILRFPFCLYICLKYDRLIIYHSEGFYFYFPIFIIFRNKIVLQVNEIYSNVSGNRLNIYFESTYIKRFQNLIVSNTNLKEVWFRDKRILVRGGYFRLPIPSYFDKKQSTYIYVGSIDELKMGNLNLLLNMIKTLPDDIILNLCLITSDNDYKDILRVSEKKGNVNIFRNVNDAQLKDIYLNCKYGLVLQDSNKPFNFTSFPSKIFSYLNNGVIPVAQRNQSFLKSEISDLFLFIDNWHWENILSAEKKIMPIDKISRKLREDLLVFIYSF